MAIFYIKEVDIHIAFMNEENNWKNFLQNVREIVIPPNAGIFFFDFRLHFYQK